MAFKHEASQIMSAEDIAHIYLLSSLVMKKAREMEVDRGRDESYFFDCVKTHYWEMNVFHLFDTKSDALIAQMIFNVMF